jgi:hypothetical protein
MPALTEAEQVGKREELADFVTNIEAQATPFTTMVPKGKKPNQTLIQFQMERFPDTDHEGVLDGEDVATFDSVGRKMAQALPQKQWWNPAVTDFAEESTVAGEGGKTEMARQKIKGLIILKRKLERRNLSNIDCAVEDGAAQPFETRGAIMWLSNAAQGVYPVDATFRTPTASRHTGTLAALTEDAFNALFQSAFAQRKGPASYKGLVGVALKRHISRYSTYTDDSASQTPSRTFNQDAKSKALINVIDKLVLDTGEVDLMLSSFLATAKDTGAATAYTSRSGIFIDPANWTMWYTRQPRVKDLEDRGGGPRAIIDAIAALGCRNPLGEVLVLSSADS